MFQFLYASINTEDWQDLFRHWTNFFDRIFGWLVLPSRKFHTLINRLINARHLSTENQSKADAGMKRLDSPNMLRVQKQHVRHSGKPRGNSCKKQIPTEMEVNSGGQRGYHTTIQIWKKKSPDDARVPLPRHSHLSSHRFSTMNMMSNPKRKRHQRRHHHQEATTCIQRRLLVRDYLRTKSLNLFLSLLSLETEKHRHDFPQYAVLKDSPNVQLPFLVRWKQSTTTYRKKSWNPIEKRTPR